MRHGLRFKIVDLFVFTLAIALGCAAARGPDLSWWNGTVVTMSVIVAVTAGRECIALDRARISATPLTQDQSFELTFLAWGRFSVVLVLAAVLSLDLLYKQHVIDLPEGPDFFSEVGQTARSGLIDLALLICLCSPTFPRQKRLSLRWRVFISALGCLGAITWGLIALADATLLHFLVFIAVHGIESAQPARFARLAPQQSEWIFAQSWIANGVATLALFGALHVLVRIWRTRPRLRAGLLAVLVIGTTYVGVSSFYLIANGFSAISPAMFEGISVGPLHRWAAAFALILVAAVAWSYVMNRDAQSMTTAGNVSLTGSTAGVLAPALVFVLYGIAGAWTLYESVINPYANLLWDTAIWERVLGALVYPTHYLSMAVWLTAAVQLWRVWRNRRTPPRVVLCGLPRATYLTVATCSVLLGAIGAAAIAWLSFALWLTPWYRWIG